MWPGDVCCIISICPSGYLEFEGVRVVGAGDEVCVHAGAPAEGAFVGGLLVVPVLRLDALPVAGGRVGGADRLTTCTETHTTPWY